MPPTAKTSRAHMALAALVAEALAAMALTIPASVAADGVAGERLPTGARITPTAAPGSLFQPLDPGLPSRAGFLADHAVSIAANPDGGTLLVLTSGYNRNADPSGAPLAAESNEYVFVVDVAGDLPVKRQVLQVPNTFGGIAWHPGGHEFYVTGGVDDDVHVYSNASGAWAEAGTPISLGHAVGLGVLVKPQAAGIAVNRSGTAAVVANFENDSITVVDLVKRVATAELDLRPGVSDPARTGVPGGEFPLWVVVRGDSTAYVSSQRDQEVVVVDLGPPSPRVTGRIAVGPQPNKMILDRAGKRLFVANGNGDSVSVVDTASGQVADEIPVTAPRFLFSNPRALKGANPNGLALSPDERTLYVTDGGLNAVAVVRLGTPGRSGCQDGDEEASDVAECPLSRVVGLIPTGWYPSDVALDASGRRLFVINAKSNAGANPGGCRDTITPALGPCVGTNQYVWQLEKAGLLSLPVPSGHALASLSRQVAANNHFPSAGRHGAADELMGRVRSRVRHVIYVIKENRTYDQVLGDLGRGNGDPALALFKEPIAPNHHRLARSFVTLDNFFDSGETSGVGWNWTTSARTTDIVEKTQPVNYAGRGLSYDWEGTNRNVNVGLESIQERQLSNPLTPGDPNLLPGTKDVSAAQDAGEKAIYLWDAALKRGLRVRNYGCLGDLARYSLPAGSPGSVPLDRNSFASGSVQFFPTKQPLLANSDPYFRGYDQKYPDYWRYKEWEREFEIFEESGDLPALELVRFPHDHFGSFGAAIDGLNTPELQMADNDYAVGLLVERVAHSRYRDDTLVFVVEDDAQDGPDHVDAHRSIAYVVGPFVKQGAVVSTPYSTVDMVRTIEEVLGLEPMGLTDGLATPMSDLFEHERRPWTYQAIVPPSLRGTQLPLPPPVASESGKRAPALAGTAPRRDAAWWQKATAGMEFGREDAVDSDRFNRVLWAGVMGEDVPYPAERHGRDLAGKVNPILQGARASGER